MRKLAKDVNLNFRLDKLTMLIIKTNAKKNKLSISDYLRNLVYLDITRDEYDEAVEILREQEEGNNEQAGNS